MRHLVLTWLLVFPLLAQGQKGLRPLSGDSPVSSGQTFAVVIGISDYQSPAIPDLRFAHRDALAFVDWLASPLGGSVPPPNIRLLINEQAKNAQIVAELDGLAEAVQPGDLAIIYFSGHGDMETKTRNQFGFLLAWDSPPNNYKAGAYPLIFLQDIISTISDKGASVLVIADACHAGKLAGSAFGGTQATAQSLTTQFANEVKILSCQPNEFSLEGEQWGGGRGVFSWFLIDGLAGMADQNHDQLISLHEMDRFLGDVVPEQSAPHNQFPMVVGNKQTILTRVDLAALTALEAKQGGLPKILTLIDSKGQADNYLGESDSLNKVLYHKFELALETGNLLNGPECADSLYRILSGVEALQPIHNLMRRNLAASLQNDPQQALNALLESDPYEVTDWRVKPDKYAEYPRYLDRAMQLLGERHYMHNTLMAKKRYFEAYQHLFQVALLDDHPLRREMELNQARILLQDGLNYEPSGAYLYHAMATTYFGRNPIWTDSATVYCQKAMEFAPNWLLPYIDLFYDYHVVMNDHFSGEKWLNKALEQQPQSYLVLERLAWLRQWQNQTEEAQQICRQMIELKPDLFSGYASLGVTYWMRGEYLHAIDWLSEAQNMPHEFWVESYLISSYFHSRNFHTGYRTAKAVLNSNSIHPFHKTGCLAFLMEGLFDYQRLDLVEKSFFGLADSLQGGLQVLGNVNEAKILFALGWVDQAIDKLQGVFDIDKTPNTAFALADAWLGRIAASQGNLLKAKEHFERAMIVQGQAALDRVLPMEEACALYGHFLLDQNRLVEAEQRFREALAWRHDNSWRGWFGLACLYAKQEDPASALDCLEKALDNFFPIPGPILSEPLFDDIRETERFQSLIRKHFPELDK